MVDSTLPARTGTATSSANDEVAIRALIGQIEQGWNSHDGDAFAAPFAADADYVVVDGRYLVGRAAIAEGHRHLFATVYRDSHSTAAIQGVRFLRDDIDVAHVRWSLVDRLDGTERRGQSLTTLTLTRDQGRWSIATFHNNRIVEPGSARA